MPSSLYSDVDASLWLDNAAQYIFYAEALRDEVEQLSKVSDAFPTPNSPAPYMVREYRETIERRLSDAPNNKRLLDTQLRDMERRCKRDIAHLRDRLEREGALQASNAPPHNPNGPFVRHFQRLMQEDIERTSEALEMLREAKRILDSINV